MHILIVEDDLLNRELMEAQVEDLGDVEAVGRAEVALERLADKLPDVMIVDLAMPGMNGFELIERVYAMPGKVPMVVVSALDLSAAQLEELTSWGVVVVLEKGRYDSEGILDAVRDAAAQGEKA